MSNVKNRDMRHLLSLTEEDIKSAKQITWNELRDAAWSTRSVTEDMRYMNTQRLLHEIKSRIEYAAYTVTDGIDSYHEMLSRTTDLLQHYTHMGAINHYDVQSVTHGPDGITAEVTIVPTASIERISIEIRLDS